MQIAQVRPDAGGVLTADEAAAYIGVKRQTLAAWRCAKRDGPTFLKVGRLVKYRVADLNRWLDGCAVVATDPE